MIHNLSLFTHAGAVAVPWFIYISVPWSDAQALYATRNLLASAGILPLYVVGHCTYDLG